MLVESFVLLAIQGTGRHLPSLALIMDQVVRRKFSNIHSSGTRSSVVGCSHACTDFCLSKLAPVRATGKSPLSGVVRYYITHSFLDPLITTGGGERDGAKRRRRAAAITVIPLD